MRGTAFHHYSAAPPVAATSTRGVPPRHTCRHHPAAWTPTAQTLEALPSKNVRFTSGAHYSGHPCRRVVGTSGQNPPNGSLCLCWSTRSVAPLCCLIPQCLCGVTPAGLFLSALWDESPRGVAASVCMGRVCSVCVCVYVNVCFVCYCMSECVLACEWMLVGAVVCECTCVYK